MNTQYSVALRTILTRKFWLRFYTFIIFPHTSNFKQKPEYIGKKLGEYLKVNSSIISDFNVVKGFLNLDLSNNYLISIFNLFVLIM